MKVEYYGVITLSSHDDPYGHRTYWHKKTERCSSKKQAKDEALELRDLHTSNLQKALRGGDEHLNYDSVENDVSVWEFHIYSKEELAELEGEQKVLKAINEKILIQVRELNRKLEQNNNRINNIQSQFKERKEFPDKIHRF